MPHSHENDDSFLSPVTATLPGMDSHDARTCVIFGAGDYYDETPAIPDDAFVVAADGGLDHVRAFGIDADFVVGDFDSITGGRPTQNDHTIALPSEKDDPDLLSALKIGWLRGDGSIVTAICDGALDFPADDAVAGRMVSVFSHSDISTGVSETGLKYELHHADMSSTRVNGLSNEFLAGRPSRITVEHGTLIVTFPIEAPLPHVARWHGFSGDLGALDTDVSSALVEPSGR